MEYLKVDKAFADKYNKIRSEDGSFMIEFAELKDGSFILPIEVKDLLPEKFVNMDVEVVSKMQAKSIVSITDEKLASSKNGLKRPSGKLTPL
jgi:hypothetical protein